MTKLSECEEQVMTVIWSSNEALDMRATLDAVNKKYGHEWKTQTVSTFLQRLVKKGLLEPARKGRYTFYTPAVKLEDYRREKINDLVNMLYNGDVDAAKADLR